jgi:hypothetical protein
VQLAVQTKIAMINLRKNAFKHHLVIVSFGTSVVVYLMSSSTSLWCEMP